MECRGVKTILAVAAILVFLVGESSASKCYDKCYADCRSHPDNPSWWCKYHCTLDCLIPAAQAPRVDSHCSFACAKSCGQRDPGQNDMGACLSACSKSCTKVRKSL
ncbi:uncharacterized protein [Elaeis guineensis]|uniref:uncharacterized protein n=1 Tax=Elaeis guineensis var. tenera TaxID=51953 RepID=UPI003C6D598E